MAQMVLDPAPLAKACEEWIEAREDEDWSTLGHMCGMERRGSGAGSELRKSLGLRGDPDKMIRADVAKRIVLAIGMIPADFNF
jgi:hypothetical protein